MRSIFFALCLLPITLLADSQMTSNYNLPDLSKNWIVGNKIENDMMTTLIFIPKGTTRETAKEFFGLNLIKKGGDVHDTSGFKQGLAKMFPKMKIDLWELDKKNDSLLYEWNGKENGKEKVHGWGRSFTTKNGNMVIGYLIENIADVARARSTWLPILKKAKAQ